MKRNEAGVNAPRGLLGLDPDTVRREYERYLAAHPSPIGSLGSAFPGLLRAGKLLLGEEEVSSLCALGLITAIQMNDPAKARGAQLFTFAIRRMRGVVGKAVQKRSRASKNFPMEVAGVLDGVGGRGEPDAAMLAEAKRRYEALPGDEMGVIGLRLGLEDDPLSFAQIAARTGRTAEAVEEVYLNGISTLRGDWVPDTPADGTAGDTDFLRDDDPNSATGYLFVIRRTHMGRSHYYGKFGNYHATTTRRRTPRLAAADMVAFLRHHFGRRWREYVAARHTRGWSAVEGGGGWIARVHVVCRGEGDEVSERVVHVARGPDGSAVDMATAAGVRPVATLQAASKLAGEWVARTFGAEAGVRVRRCWAPPEPPPCKRSGPYARTHLRGKAK